jgi:hypothetical protein
MQEKINTYKIVVRKPERTPLGKHRREDNVTILKKGEHAVDPSSSARVTETDACEPSSSMKEEHNFLLAEGLLAPQEEICSIQ